MTARLWRLVADLIVPPAALHLEPRCRYTGTDRLLARLLENGALT